MSLDGDFRKPGRGDEEPDHFGEHAKQEVRWLLPYADMITLLFALFIVMYALSSVNNAKMEAVQQSVRKAFNGSKATPGQTDSPEKSQTPQNASEHLLNSGMSLMQLQRAVQNAKERKAEDERLRRLQERIDRYTRTHGLQNKVSTRIDERGLVIRLISDKVLFDNGQATIRPAARPVLQNIASVLRSERNHVRVEGHTDNVPIHTAMFATNWELSAVRATSVVRLLAAYGLNQSRLSATGYGSKRPLAANTTDSGRQSNRRVEIVVLRSTSLLGSGVDPSG